MKRSRQDSAHSSSSNSAKKGKSSVELRVCLEENIQYVGRNFTVTVLLLGADGQLHTDNSDKYTLTRPQLCYKDNHQETCSEDFLEIDEETWSPHLQQGRVTFQAKINTLSRDQAGREFCIFVDTCDPEVGPAYSNPVSVVSYRLSLLSSVPSKFYNQMGGGSNCITLDIHCKDHSNNFVTSTVPLEILLIYADDGEVVRTQEILTKSDDSQMATVQGKAVMKVRIEHVSRKHQNRTFAIKVRPNLLIDPLCANVASVVSSPINVLSKITPRDKRTEVKIAAHRNRILSSVNGGGSFDGSDDGMSNSNSLPQPLILPPSNIPTSQPLSLSALSQPMHAHFPPQPVQSVAAPIFDDESDSGMGGGGGGAANRVPTIQAPVAEALSNVLSWIDGTLKCLCEAKWQQVGYEQANDNTPDMSRPLFAMTNPNDRIQAQLDIYRNKVMGSLQTVLEGIEPLLEHTQTTTTITNTTTTSVASTNGGAAAAQDHHPEPLLLDHHHHHSSNHHHLHHKPALSRSGSDGIPGSAEFDSLVSGAVGGFDASSDPMLPLLRGLSRGFSDFGSGGADDE